MLGVFMMWYKDGEQFKSDNGYVIGGMWHPRVTKILDIKSKPALDAFFKEMGSYDSAEKVKNKSAEEGTLVHGVIERIVRGEEVAVPETIGPAIDAFLKFNADKKIIFHPEYIERRVWSQRHRYAGTVDALVTIDGKFGVLDIKTSSGFYPEYNLQTAAYVSALKEFDVKRHLSLPRDIDTRWILKVDQHRVCVSCHATLREKGGRRKIRQRSGGDGVTAACGGDHQWGMIEGSVALREFPYLYGDTKAFIAAKILWEWENGYWLRKIGYNQ